MKMSNLATKSHFFLSGNNVEVFLPVKETQEIPPEAIFFEVCKEKLEVFTLYRLQLYVSADYRKTRFFRNRRPPARKHM
jgi:hypothetical protein